MAIAELTREAVLKAVAEFERLGRSEFLDKYGYRPARSYRLALDGREYDSKAIAGAAHGYLGVGYSALRPDDFSGGERTVATALRRLGFDVVSRAGSVSAAVLPFVAGQVYNRRQAIHAVFGGQQQGGISTPSDAPFIFLFTSNKGEAHGYQDHWSDDGTFAYCGEGQTGDQEFIRGNRAIRHHLDEGKDLLLFEASGSANGAYRFIGVFACAGFETQLGNDRDGNSRRLLIFKLLPVATIPDAELDREDIPAVPLDELRQRAYAAASHSEAVGSSARTYYERSRDVRVYVLARASGRCEACGDKAPLLRKNGAPYLEPHHTLRVSDGGPDHPRWVAAVCPNCHRRIHHSRDGAEVNKRLMDDLEKLEVDVGNA